MSNTAFFFFLLYTSGVTVISYKGYAMKQGWPIGSMFESDSSILKILAILSIFGSIISSFFYIKWYFVLSGLIIGWLLSGALTGLLAKHTQLFSIILFLTSWLFLFVKF